MAQQTFVNYPGQVSKNTADFETSLCVCSPCCYGCCCPLCLMTDVSAQLDNADQCCCYPASTFKNRVQARSYLGYKPSLFSDLLLSICCGACSNCQVYTELQRKRQAGRIITVPVAQSNRHNQWQGSFWVCSPFCYGWYAPCCLASDVAAELDNADQCCCCCYPGSSVKNRFQAKALFGIETSPCWDCCVGLLCGVCSDCQILDELKKRRANAMSQLQSIQMQQMHAPPQHQQQYYPPPQHQQQYHPPPQQQYVQQGPPPHAYPPQQQRMR